MKTKVTMRALSILLSIAMLLTYHSANSQILGPFNVCMGECYTFYYAPMDGVNDMEPDRWEISFGDTTYILSAEENNSVTVCFDESVPHTITALSDTDEVLGSQTVFAGNFSEAELMIVSPASCRDQRPLGQNCIEVCEGTEVVFEFRDIEGVSAEWWFDGHGEIISEGRDYIRILFYEGGGHAWIGYYGGHGDECVFEGGTCVTVVEKKPAGFNTFPGITGDSITLCKGQSIRFENTSLSDDVSWFAPGISSAEGDVFTADFNQAGTYEITQAVGGVCGCDDSKSVVVNVLEDEAAPIYCAGSVCEGDTVKYHTHPDCQPYHWSIDGDATIVSGGGENDDFIQLIWNGGSAGTVSLQTDCSESCFYPTEEIVYILGRDSRIEGPQKVCTGETYLFSVQPRDGTSFHWEVQNGSIVSGQNTSQIRANFSSSTMEPYVVIEMEDCSRDCRVTDTLFLELAQPFSINGPESACPGEEITFEAVSSNTPANANWEILNEEGQIVLSESDAQPDFSFSLPDGGEYTIVAYPDGDDFCVSKGVGLIHIADGFADVPFITGEEFVCTGGWYEYSTSVPDGTAVFPAWEVTNGSETNTYFSEAILVNWLPDPDNQIRLRWVDNLSGCESEWNSYPISNLEELNIGGQDSLCIGATTIYTLEHETEGPVEWEIENPASGLILGYPDGNSVEIQWKTSGTTRLHATFCGLTAGIDINIVEPEEPVVPDQLLCQSETTIVTTVNQYSEYKWYEEGRLVCETPVCNLEKGSYLLVVSDSLGCIGRTRFELEEVSIPPFQIFNLDPAGICEGDKTRLISTFSHDPDYSYNWYLDGELVLSGRDTLPAVDTGNYELVLTHILTGCERKSPIFEVCRFCEENFVLEDCRLPDRITPGGGGSGGGDDDPIIVDTEIRDQCNRIMLIANSSDLIDSTVIWKMCDGELCIFITGNPATYTFQNSGSQTVTVSGYALDSLGNRVHLTTQWFHPIDYNELDFKYSQACTEQDIEFEPIVQLQAGDEVESYEWDFGDPSSGPNNFSNLENPVHQFSSPGDYIVTLTIRTEYGCEIIKEKTISVLEKPEAYFEVSGSPCYGSVITAVSQSTEEFHNWSFDAQNFPDRVDGITNEAHFIYEQAGTYQIALEIEALNGCTDTFSRIINIDSFPELPVIVSHDDFPLCPDDFGILEVEDGPYEEYLWSNGSQDSSITAVGNGPFFVTVTNANGCKKSAGPFIPDYLSAPNAEIGGRLMDGGPLVRSDTLFACYGSAIEVLAIVSEDGGLVEWSDGSTQTALRFDGVESEFLEVGLHAFQFEVSSLNSGCTTEAPTFFVRIYPVPEKPLLSVDPDYPLCAGTETTLTVVNTSSEGVYLWNNGDEGDELITFEGGNYHVRHFNDYNCYSESDPVKINPLPNLNFFPKGCQEICHASTICLPLPAGYELIDWRLNSGSEPLPADPSNIEVDTSGVYTGIFSNAHGCTVESPPFTITIFDGSGDISGMVFGDLDGDLVFSAADTVFENLKIELWQGGVLIDSAFTNSSGTFNFTKKELGTYQLTVSESSIPNGWILVSDFVEVELTTCGLVVVSDPLIFTECVEDTATFELLACSGDSIEVHGMYFHGDTVVIFSTDGFDCDQREEYTLTFYPSSIVQLDSILLCHGDSIELNHEYFFTDTLLTFTYQNQYGCDSIEFLNISFMPERHDFVSINLCPGESYEFDGNILEGDTIITRLVQDSLSGCVVQKEVQIETSADFDILPTAYPACPGAEDGAIKMEYLPDASIDYFVVGGDTLPPLVELTGFSAGTYQIEAVDNSGCKSNTEVTITERKPLEVVLDDLELSCNREAQWLELEVLSGQDEETEIIWYNGESGTRLQVDKPGVYEVEVSNQCQNKVMAARAFIAEEEQELRHYVPNAFSPNEDGVNDEFKPYFPPEMTIHSYKFDVYDRWGNRVFKSSLPGIGWDGNIDKSAAETAVFVWVLEVEVSHCGETKSILSSGDVNLMR